MHTTEWLGNIKAMAEIQTTAFTSKKDYQYLDVKLLLKIAEKVDYLSETCVDCKKHKKQIKYLVENLATFSETFTKRKEYDKKKNLIFQHLRKEHRMFPNNYFTSIHSFTGMLGGSVLGYLISFLPFAISTKYPVIICCIIGLAIGRIIGDKMDFKVKKENRTL